MVRISMINPESFSTNPKWYTKLTNSFPLMIDDSYIKTIAIAWGYKLLGEWCFIPSLVKENWQYTNAIFSIRFGLPFACFVQIRWSSNRFIQFGLGWKQSGRFAIHCRIQTDESAARGYHINMPNNNQATGWNYGGK